MQHYKVELDPKAQKDLEFWKKNSKIIHKKMVGLLHELEEHPRTGTGKPHPLTTIKNGWARKLSDGNRLQYLILDKMVYVYVISARGHYDDH